LSTQLAPVSNCLGIDKEKEDCFRPFRGLQFAP
jgi:hypothetical protein